MHILLVLPLLLSLIPVYAESHPEYSVASNAFEYVLDVDEHTFAIPYQVNANVLEMAVDQELSSFLIGLQNTRDSIMTIDLEHKLINATNNEFVVLVNGLEVDYKIVSDADSSTLSFYVPTFTEEVEIIGTHVIPEFPLGAIIGFTVLISAVLVVSKIKTPFRL